MSASISTPLRLAPPRPNPTRGVVELPFTLARRASVSLIVCDVSGRPVARLLAGTLEAGEHWARWSGLTAAGAPAPAGVYWGVLRAGSERAAARFVVMP